MNFASQEVRIERRADGAALLRAAQPLPAYPGKLTAKLEHWAAKAPARILFAQREASGGWRSVSYSDALRRAQVIGAYLLSKNLSAERPLVVLSGNDIEHALLHLGAMYVGVPYAPVSPAYSLLSSDFAKLRFIRELLTPGLLFANGPQFRHALKVFEGIDVLENFEDSSRTGSIEEALEAHRRVGPDTIAKFLFTSGSTGTPKAVINTQPGVKTWAPSTSPRVKS